MELHQQNIWGHKKRKWQKTKQTWRKKAQQGQKTNLQYNQITSRVDEGHCNVASAVGSGQAFVEMSQSSWVHEAPAFPWWMYGTVIPMETATPALKVCVFVIEGDVDGEGGGVMMGSQVCLPLRRVFHHEVH